MFFLINVTSILSLIFLPPSLHPSLPSPSFSGCQPSCSQRCCSVTRLMVAPSSKATETLCHWLPTRAFNLIGWLAGVLWIYCSLWPSLLTLRFWPTHTHTHKHTLTWTRLCTMKLCITIKRRQPVIYHQTNCLNALISWELNNSFSPSQKKRYSFNI